MFKKMGRPKVPKKEAKNVLVGAMMSAAEARTVQKDAEKAKLDKSKWIRKRLLESLPSSPQEHNPELPIQIFLEANLLDLESQLLSTGLALFFPRLGTGEFYPTTNFEKISGILPASTLTLKTSNGRLYKLTQADRMCHAANKAPHFDFDYEAI